MPLRLPKLISSVVAAVALAVWQPAPAQELHRPQLALMGTIPIFWGEADSFSDLVNGSAEVHWARERLEREFELVPVDFLAAETLARHKFLVLAQPRALAPEENVVLDSWVRDGGRLLLFADPMMTGHSRFSVGDRRRPQDVALLSPILTHWGLELRFDEGQEAGLALVDHFAVPVPVNLPGELVPEDGRFECVVSGGGVLAHCVFGVGEVMVLADAAMLDIAGPTEGAAEALGMLTSHLFGSHGENAGNHAEHAQPADETHGNQPLLKGSSMHGDGRSPP